jgi:hypothetical protein
MISCSHGTPNNVDCLDCIWFLEQEAKRLFPRKKKVAEVKEEVLEEPKDTTESLIALEEALEREQKEKQDVDALINIYEEMTKQEQDDHDALVAYYMKREEEEKAEQDIIDAEFMYDRTHCASCFKEMEMSKDGGRPVCSVACHDDLELERRMSYDKYRKY